MLNPLEEICFRLSTKAHRGQSAVAHNPATMQESAYTEWREDSLKRQYLDNFDGHLLSDKRVLDFGCGRGTLSLFAASCGAKAVVGTDLSERDLAIAEKRAAGLDNVKFIKADPATVPLSSQSVDVILCFDVMEHIMNYKEIIHEWRRVLAPGGRVLIWWMVWLHPYGHHLQTLIPLPWVHLFLSDAALLRIAARIYDTPEFKPRIWHFDENGGRKANPYTGRRALESLNKLTIRAADKAFRDAGLKIARKEIHPFTGETLGLLKRMMVKVSPVPDLFSSCVIYELVAGGATV